MFSIRFLGILFEGLLIICPVILLLVFNGVSTAEDGGVVDQGIERCGGWLGGARTVGGGQLLRVRVAQSLFSEQRMAR